MSINYGDMHADDFVSDAASCLSANSREIHLSDGETYANITPRNGNTHEQALASTTGNATIPRHLSKTGEELASDTSATSLPKSDESAAMELGSVPAGFVWRQRQLPAYGGGSASSGPWTMAESMPAGAEPVSDAEVVHFIREELAELRAENKELKEQLGSISKEVQYLKSNGLLSAQRAI